MQSINDAQQSEAQERDIFIRAEDLRDITLTKEQLFDIQKNNLCETLMESMVKVATNNGAFVYASNILEDMDDRLRTEIVDHFKGLGYDVLLSEVLTTEQQTQQGVKKFVYRVLSIGWGKKEEASEEAN